MTKNAPNVPLWSVNGNYKSGLTTLAGSFVSTSSDPASAIYTAPPSPPIYTDDQVKAGAIQGAVSIAAGVSYDHNLFDQIVTSETFIVIGPINVGLSPSNVSVQISGSQQFSAYVVGSLNNALIWQVESVVGGGTAYGSISPAGLYIAPAAVPMTGNLVTVTAVSQADPTAFASSVVSLDKP